jgi:hypothetical protein
MVTMGTRRAAYGPFHRKLHLPFEAVLDDLLHLGLVQRAILQKQLTPRKYRANMNSVEWHADLKGRVHPRDEQGHLVFRQSIEKSELVP